MNFDDMKYLRIENSRGVRKCKSCGLKIFKGIPNLTLNRLIETDFSKSGGALRKEYYCVICAESTVKEAIRKCKEEKKRWIKGEKEGKYFVGRANSLDSDIEEHKKLLPKLKNWRKFLNQLMDGALIV